MRVKRTCQFAKASLGGLPTRQVPSTAGRKGLKPYPASVSFRDITGFTAGNHFLSHLQNYRTGAQIPFGRRHLISVPSTS